MVETSIGGQATFHGGDDEVRTVEPARWRDEVRSALEAGHRFLDLMDCVDELGRSDELRLVLRLVDFSAHPPRGLQLHVRVPRDEPRLDRVDDLVRGAAWHQREVHDFFGVEFQGADLAPLLNHDRSLRPLRKDFVLAARAAQPWPGAKEPGESAAAPSRRRMAPPGVPDPAVWGDRDPALGPVAAEELAAEVSGSRVRRRR